MLKHLIRQGLDQFATAASLAWRFIVPQLPHHAQALLPLFLQPGSAAVRHDTTMSSISYDLHGDGCHDIMEPIRVGRTTTACPRLTPSHVRPPMALCSGLHRNIECMARTWPQTATMSLTRRQGLAR